MAGSPPLATVTSAADSATPATSSSTVVTSHSAAGTTTALAYAASVEDTAVVMTKVRDTAGARLVAGTVPVGAYTTLSSGAVISNGCGTAQLAGVNVRAAGDSASWLAGPSPTASAAVNDTVTSCDGAEVHHSHRVVLPPSASVAWLPLAATLGVAASYTATVMLHVGWNGSLVGTSPPPT